MVGDALDARPDLDPEPRHARGVDPSISPGWYPLCGQLVWKYVGNLTRVRLPRGSTSKVGLAKSVSWNAASTMAMVTLGRAGPGASSGKQVIPY